MGALRDREKVFKFDPGLRRFVADPLRKNILPFSLAFNSALPGNSYPVTIQASGTPTQAFEFQQPLTLAQGSAELGSPFLWQSGVFQDSAGAANSVWTMMLKNTGRAKQYMNLPLHVRTVLGTAQTPVLLREPLFFKAMEQISCYLDKISGGSVTARIYMAGTQYCTWSTDFYGDKASYARMAAIIKKYEQRCQYVTPTWLAPDQGNGAQAVTLSANATTTIENKLAEDSQYEFFTMSAVSTGNFSLEISEVKTKQLLMNGVITQTNGIGTNLFPTIFPCAYLIPAGFRLRFKLTDLSNGTNSIWLTLHGRRIYAPLREVKEVLNDTDVFATPADSPTQMAPAPSF